MKAGHLSRRHRILGDARDSRCHPARMLSDGYATPPDYRVAALRAQMADSRAPTMVALRAAKQDLRLAFALTVLGFGEVREVFLRVPT